MIHLAFAYPGHEKFEFNSGLFQILLMEYWMTIQVVTNLPLTSKQKFCFTMRPVY